MSNFSNREPAWEPEDLARFFMDRANAGDVEGLVALYEPQAVIALTDGQCAIGREAIRELYTKLVSEQRKFEAGTQRPAVRRGNLALTSSRLVSGQVTAEVAHQQADGSWLWVIDQPAISR